MHRHRQIVRQVSASTSKASASVTTRLARPRQIQRQSAQQVGGEVPSRAARRPGLRRTEQTGPCGFAAAPGRTRDPPAARRRNRAPPASRAEATQASSGAAILNRRPPPQRDGQNVVSDSCAPQQRRASHERREIVRKRRCAEQCPRRQRKPSADAALSAQQQRHARQRQQLRQRKAARDRPGIYKSIATEGQQHRRYGRNTGHPCNRRNHAECREAEQHRGQSRGEQRIADQAPPGGDGPEIQRRMHICCAQIMCDRGEAHVSCLQALNVAGRECIVGPVGAPHAGGEKQRVLLVVFGPAHPGSGNQHQRCGGQSGQQRLTTRVHAALFTGS